MDGGKIVSFSTGDEREYPLAFCQKYAVALKERAQRTGDFSFVEIFSGPNAPLTCEVAKALGEKPPLPPSLASSVGVTSELNDIGNLRPAELSEVAGSSLNNLAEELPSSVETDQYRLAAVDSGKQPTYGKRLQLIPDWDIGPVKHLELAKKLEHPFAKESSLKEDHRTIIEAVIRDGPDIGLFRLAELDKLKKLVGSCESEQRLPSL